MRKETSDDAVAVLAVEIPLNALTALVTRNEAAFGEGFEPPATSDSWRAVFTDQSQRWYAIVDRPDNDQAITVIGLVVFSRWTPAPWRSAEIGFGLDTAVVGQGVIQRTVPRLLHALLHGELARIEARVDPTNERASRAVSALGFNFEGHARGCLDGSVRRRTQAQWAIITADLPRDNVSTVRRYDSIVERG